MKIKQTYNKSIIFIIIILSLINKQTEALSNCDNITTLGVGNTCNQCSTGYYSNNYDNPLNDPNDPSSGVALYDCKPCPGLPYCTSCTNSSVCTGCDTANRYHLITPGNTSCGLCNFYKCTTCIDGPKCSVCADGYFLDTTNSLCMPCYYPCLTCSTVATNCTSCYTTVQTFYFDTNQCSLCNAGSKAMSNCKLCNDTGTECLECINKQFFPNVNMCDPCTTPCKTCQNANDCLTCVNYTTFYNTSTLRCDLCSLAMPNCATCINPTVCLTCTSGFFYVYPPDSCVTCVDFHPQCTACNQSVSGPICTACNTKFYPDTYGYCRNCRYQCAACSGYDSCSSCLNNNYVLVNTSVCIACSSKLPNCLQCQYSSAYQCLICTNNTVPDLTNKTCVTCNITHYAQSSNQSCVLCATPCVTCTTFLDCLSCQPFYKLEVNSKRCIDICGDKIVLNSYCDNGYEVLNDGCSDDCTQEQDYICQLFPKNTTLANGSSFSYQQSVCSYMLNPKIQLNYVKKDTFSNSMTITYKILPYLYGLPGTTSKVFTLDQLKMIFLMSDIGTGQSIIPQDITFDPSRSKVSIKIPYDQYYKESQFSMTLDIQYLNTNLPAPNNFASAPATNAIITNNVISFYQHSLAGVYYSEEIYPTAQLLSNLALMISILSLLSFFLGIFSKELAGLQMAMLSQFAFISLMYYEGAIDLSFFVLKQLQYSSGYNIQYPYQYASQLSSNPPQSINFQFSAHTFINNFNIMGLFYILPLIFVLPFIPLKAKCIRKLTIIQIGHKWVDLLLGQIYLTCVLFNYQYFLVCVISYYMDGRNMANYSSSMIIWIGLIVTLFSFLGLIFKPQIYGNFRTAFKYDNELLKQKMQQKQKTKAYEQNLTQKFSRSKCSNIRNYIDKLKIFINQNYFWKNYRNIHTILTYNHYTIVIGFFTINTLCLIFINSSQIILMIFAFLMMVQVVLLRPYGQVSQKIRAIYFYFVYIYISLIRFIYNNSSNSQISFLLPITLLIFLAIGLIWTYINLGFSFYNYFTMLFSDRNKIVQKIFDADYDNFKQIRQGKGSQEQDALIKKLMKRYQRVQLQYNYNDARNQLLATSVTRQDRPLLTTNNQQEVAQISPPKQEKLLPQQIIKKLQQQKNFKQLKKIVQIQKSKRKKKIMKKKVSGQKMLKLLSLDNFNKYQQQFLQPIDDKIKNMNKQQKDLYQNQQQEQENEQQKQKIQKVPQQIKQQQEQQQDVYQDSYKSVQPNNLEQVQQKLDQEKVIIEQNSHLRFQRAIKLISKFGFQVDQQIIQQNYDRI